MLTQELDLTELLTSSPRGKELLADDCAFRIRPKKGERGMWDWEHDVLVLLFSQGWESKSEFWTVDGDDFGPLVRGVELRKFGSHDKKGDWLLYTYG